MLYAESDVVELKETYVEDIRKEIIAFANTNGGTLFVGVKDSGEVIGVDDPDAITLQIANSCRDAVKPDITMFLAYETVEIVVPSPSGKCSAKVLAVHVQRGTSRPYYLASKGLKPSGVFVRQGTSSAPASDEAIRRMIKETDGDSFEDMRSLNQALTFDEASRLFQMKELPFGPVQMKTLGLINEENLYTNLALLLSDQCPHLIKAATFQGSDQNDFQDRREFTGSLLKQLNDAYSYLDFRNQTRATFQGLYRTDIKDYSEKAIREALLNAIEHRDYSFFAPTLLSIFADRIEFVSYGGLAGGVQIADVLNGLSVCRNPKLAGVFYRLNLVEAYGTGLPKIRKAYDGKSCQPEFIAGPTSFRVVLPNVNTSEATMQSKTEGIPSTVRMRETGMDDTMAKAFRLIQAGGKVTRRDVAEKLGLSAATTVRALKKLKDAGLIVTLGNGKNIRYDVSDDERVF